MNLYLHTKSKNLPRLFKMCALHTRLSNNPKLFHKNSLQIRDGAECDDAIDYLKAVEKIEMRDMSKSMFLFLKSKARSVYRYIHDIQISDCNLPYVNRFLFTLARLDYLDFRPFNLLELVYKKETDAEREKWLAEFLDNPIDLENF